MTKHSKREQGSRLSAMAIRALSKSVPCSIVVDNGQEFVSIEMDHTKLDIWVLDDVRGCRRPTMREVRVHGGGK